MRIAVGLLLLAAGLGLAQAPKEGPKKDEPKDGDLAKRYGINADLTYYPQDKPQTALQSVLKAIERKRIDYLLAHLADPRFVDDRVTSYGGSAAGFEELVRETTRKLIDEPGTVKELQRFLKEGEWEEGEGTASARLKDVRDRRVFLRKVGARWFLENRMKPLVEAK
jgi:hypothetical protein